MAEAVDVHPLVGSVTVTLYVPAVFIVWEGVVFPPPQSNVLPAVVDDADKVLVGLEHDKGVGTAMLTFGVAMFWLTMAEAVAVQELDGSVTVTL